MRIREGSLAAGAPNRISTKLLGYLSLTKPRVIELLHQALPERYQRLRLGVAHADAENAAGLIRDALHDAFHPVGTRAAVAEILERLDDGRLNIVVEGGERFRIVEVTEGRSFTTALVEPVEDDDEAAPELARALDLFTSLADEAESNVDIPDSDSPLLDFVADLQIRVVQQLQERWDCRPPLVFQPAQPVGGHAAHLRVGVLQQFLQHG